MENTPPISLLLIEDFPVTLEGLKACFAGQPDFVLAGCATTGAEGVSLAAGAHPGLVILNMALPDMDGVEATRRVREASPGSRVLVFSGQAPDQGLFDALHAGASGFVPKRASMTELLNAARTVAAGKSYLHPTALDYVMSQLSAPDPEPPGDLLQALTEREADVLAGMVEGLNNSQIAKKLVVSPATVHTHINHILSKLGARSRTQAVVYALRHKPRTWSSPGRNGEQA